MSLTVKKEKRPHRKMKTSLTMKKVKMNMTLRAGLEETKMMMMMNLTSHQTLPHQEE